MTCFLYKYEVSVKDGMGGDVEVAIVAIRQSSAEEWMQSHWESYAKSWSLVETIKVRAILTEYP